MRNRPTIVDVAKELGVSPSTVSRALRNHPGISETRKAEVRDTAVAMGIEVNALPDEKPKEVSGRGLLACIVPSISHPFMSQIVEKLEAVCVQEGFDLILHNSAGSTTQEGRIVNDLIERGVDGVFFVPISQESVALEECSRRLRTIALTKHNLCCPSIGSDHSEGGGLVAEHFKELGRKAVILLGTDNMKFQGFRDYIENQRLTGIRIEEVEVSAWDDRISLEAYKAILGRFTPETIKRYDAVFGFNDLAAIGAIHALEELGCRIPSDVAVCGFDDMPIAREIRPCLTSVAQPVNQIVNLGFKILRKMIACEPITNREQQVLLRPHLVVRASTFPGI